MAFIPVPDVAMVELVFRQDGQVCENTLYFQGAASWDATNLTTLAEEVRDWWIAGPRLDTSDTVGLTSVKATSLASQSAPGVEVTDLLPADGTEVSPPLPNNVTQAVTFVTALRGRSYRGRNYRVGLTEAMVVANQVDVGYTTSWVGFYQTLDTDVTVNSAQHVVVSRYENNVPRATGVATPVVSYKADRVIDSQRRRLPGRGQ